MKMATSMVAIFLRIDREIREFKEFSEFSEALSTFICKVQQLIFSLGTDGINGKFPSSEALPIKR